MSVTTDIRRSPVSSTSRAALALPRRTQIRTSVSKSIEPGPAQSLDGGLDVFEVGTVPPHAERWMGRSAPVGSRGRLGLGRLDRADHLAAAQERYWFVPFEGIQDVLHAPPQVKDGSFHWALSSRR